jgi:hypothetical protein
MLRHLSLAALVAVLVGTHADGHDGGARRKWPLRVRVAGVADRPAVFRAFSTGGALSVVGSAGTVRPLAPGDTLRATAPVEFGGDVSRGALVFEALGRDELVVTVSPGRGNPLPIAQRGRSMTLRQGTFGPELRAR